MNQPVTAQDIMRQSRGEAASQAAGVEHSRAIAEVQAAFAIAQRFPRDEAKALAKAIESCRTIEVASGAFYRFSRGGETISDASIHLATELARCWGNINYGIMELARDDAEHVSEMLAYAIDLETNTMARQTFLVPHKRDKKSGPVLLTDMRDIYENNANNGARRLREAIFRVLPPFLKERAKNECHETNVRGQGDVPIADLANQAIEAFGRIGVSRERMVAKLGPTNGWSRDDIAVLQVTIKSIKRGEISADEEFPRVGSEEVTSTARQIAGVASTQEPTLDAIADDLIARAAAAPTIEQLEFIEADAGRYQSKFDDDQAARVDAALGQASKRIHKAMKGDV